MKISLLVAFSIAILLVSACAIPTAEQRAQRIIAMYGPFCEGLGYTVNTKAWRDCVMKEHQNVRHNTILIID